MEFGIAQPDHELRAGGTLVDVRMAARVENRELPPLDQVTEHERQEHAVLLWVTVLTFVINYSTKLMTRTSVNYRAPRMRLRT